MFNISDNVKIEGLEKTGCSKGHIIDCLHRKSGHEAPEYSYFGANVSKGSVLLHTNNGDFTLDFDEKDAWARSVKIR